MISSPCGASIRRQERGIRLEPRGESRVLKMHYQSNCRVWMAQRGCSERGNDWLNGDGGAANCEQGRPGRLSGKSMVERVLGMVRRGWRRRLPHLKGEMWATHRLRRRVHCALLSVRATWLMMRWTRTTRT